LPKDADVIDLEDDKLNVKPRLVEKYTKITKSKCELTELKKNANFTKEPHTLLVPDILKQI